MKQQLTQSELKKHIRGNTKHGKSKHPLHRVWSGAKSRCYNKKDYHFKWYGALGIIMCEEWKNDFKAFYDFAIANGWEKGLEIDRRDNDGNYEPLNIRFVTHKENSNNRRELKSTNTSGYRNIGSYKKTRFRVVVLDTHVGVYDKIEEAIKARDSHERGLKC